MPASPFSSFRLPVWIRRRRVWLTALVGLLVVGLLYRPVSLLHHYYLSPCPEDGPERQTEFPMHLEPLDLTAYEPTIRQYADSWVITELDHVAYQTESYPILQLDWVGEQASRRLLIFAATHGDEFASALVVPRLLESLPMLPVIEQWDVRIITPINPVGLLEQSRYNADGCDINRDFRDFQTLGAQIQRDAVDGFRPDWIVSMHEGPQEGFFAIGTASIEEVIQTAVVDALTAEQIPLAKQSFLGLNLAQDGFMHERGLITWAKEWLGIHTLGRYAESQGIGVITTESSWQQNDMEQRIQPHVVVIETLLQQVEE